LESSILFAQEGANVLLVDINLENAEKGAAIITQRFPNVKAIATKADVGKETDVKAAVEKAVKEFGRLDVMVWLLPVSYIYSISYSYAGSLTTRVCYRIINLSK